ncbi:UBP-type zinc finger domain-containing protein [Streptomyces xanthophaeus]|uniref:UBP-type zinc finger domain-containing protein n=1 Tax=Streptomyces xanthophaeus TaxID=67385 RepID=UPI00369F939A
MVSPDGGRLEGRTCSHLTALPGQPAAPVGVCTKCRDRGWTWARLRWCATCGHVGCCDSSRGRHAYAHHAQTGHPVVLSMDPDEAWAWCFVDEFFLVRVPEG